MKRIKEDKLLIIFSFIESFLQVYGYLLYINKGITSFTFLYLLIVIFLTIPFYFINSYIFKILDFKYKKNSKYKFSTKRMFITWFVLFLLWIPVLLAYYPTLWVYDVYNQVPHLIGSKISLQHPMMHTLFIELFLFIGNTIKDYELGMLLLSIVQMLIMSGIFAYCLEKIKTVIPNKVMRFVVIFLLIIYYGLVPFNSVMSISITKDVLFSGFLLLLIIYTYDFLNGDKSKRKKILFVLMSVLILLFKNNALFTYLIFMGIIIFSCQKQLLRLSTIGLSLFIIIHFSMVMILQPNSYGKYENLSVVTYNLIEVQRKHPSIKYEDKYMSVMPLECINNGTVSYIKNRADASKNKFSSCELQRNSEYLLQVWLYYGLKYPTDYLDSWSDLTTGSWYLMDESHANTYFGRNQGYLLSDYKKIAGISDERPESKFPWLYEKLEMITTNNIQYEEATPLRFIFEPATYVLSFFLIILYMLKNKMKKELIPLSLLVALYVSILTGPVILVRYIYPYMIIVPYIFAYLMNGKREA